MVLAVALLAALTGASNHGPTGGNTPGQELTMASRPTDRNLPPGTKADARAQTKDKARPVDGSGAGTPAVAVAGGPPTTTTPGSPAGESPATAGAAPAGGGTSPEGEPGTAGTDAETERAPTRVRAAPGPAAAEPPAPPPAPVPAPVPVGLTRLSDVELEVLSLTNTDRADNGVPPLSSDSCLDSEASAWAHAMADAEVMAHSAGGGAAVQGCRGSSAFWGDNIGYWEPCLAAEMEAWWMNSPSHRPHILDANFTAVGIGVWAEPSGRCWFQVYFGS
jgi:uncharacterized protein YkwD